MVTDPLTYLILSSSHTDEYNFNLIFVSKDPSPQKYREIYSGLNFQTYGVPNRHI